MKFAKRMDGMQASEIRELLKLTAKPDIISFAIGKNAVSREEYLEGRGRRYYDIGYLRAYGHEGDPCPRCGKTFVRDTVGGRGTCWCPGCQRR